jgi:hypothetical protein
LFQEFTVPFLTPLARKQASLSDLPQDLRVFPEQFDRRTTIGYRHRVSLLKFDIVLGREACWASAWPRSSERLHDWALARLQQTVDEQKDERTVQRDSLERARAASARELENLTKLRIRDLLTDEEYLKQRQELERQQIGIAQRLETIQHADSMFEPSQLLISLSRSMVSWFKAGDIQTKRLILTIVGSNFSLMDKKLSIDVKKPFRRWSKPTQFRAVLTSPDSRVEILRPIMAPSNLFLPRRMCLDDSAPGNNPSWKSWRRFGA